MSEELDYELEDAPEGAVIHLGTEHSRSGEWVACADQDADAWHTWNFAQVTCPQCRERLHFAAPPGWEDGDYAGLTLCENDMSTVPLTGNPALVTCTVCVEDISEHNLWRAR